MNDRSTLVHGYLAQNPSVPEYLLISLHADKVRNLTHFARNPKCPNVIKDEIINSNNDLAKKLLQTTEDKVKANK